DDIRALCERVRKLNIRALVEEADPDAFCEALIPIERFGLVPSSPISTKSWKANDDKKFRNHARPTTRYRQAFFYKAHWAYVLYLRFRDIFSSLSPAPFTAAATSRQPKVCVEASRSGSGKRQNATENQPKSEVTKQKSNLQRRNDEKRRAWVDATVSSAETAIEQIAVCAKQCRCKVMVLAYRTKKKGNMIV